MKLTLHFIMNIQVANVFFDEVVSRLVGSFEGRCRTVYGPSVKVLEGTQTA